MIHCIEPEGLLRRSHGPGTGGLAKVDLGKLDGLRIRDLARIVGRVLARSVAHRTNNVSGCSTHPFRGGHLRLRWQLVSFTVGLVGCFWGTAKWPRRSVNGDGGCTSPESYERKYEHALRLNKER